MVVHIFQTRDEYDEVLKKPAAIIDCFAIWCQPCKMIAPYFVKLSDDVKHQGIHFTKFDIDEIPEVAEMNEVTIMPTFLFLENGKVVDKIEGMNLPQLNLTTREFAERVGAGITAAGEPEVEKKAAEKEAVKDAENTEKDAENTEKDAENTEKDAENTEKDAENTEKVTEKVTEDTLKLETDREDW